MSNYVVTTDFAAKDALATGNPLKVASGTQVDAELDNIATAIATKEDTANKGQNSGYASLDSSGDVPDTQIPATIPRLASSNIFSILQTIQAAGPQLVLKGNAIDNTNIAYVEFQKSNATRTGYIGDTGSGANDIAIGADAGSIVLSYTGALTANGSTVWHAGNDGAGSGLDADLLDGQSSAAFAAASHAHSAADVTSGTLAVVRGGTGTTTSTGTGNVVLSASPTLSGTVTGGTFAGTHTGDGSGITAMTATQLTSGTIPDVRIAATGVNQHNASITARNITGKTGIAKTLSTSAASGGADGDIWYQY